MHRGFRISLNNKANKMLNDILCASIADIPVTVGLEKGFYSTGEDSGELEVCVEVKSGDIAGRSITFDYTTLDGSANGIYPQQSYSCPSYIALPSVCI